MGGIPSITGRKMEVRPKLGRLRTSSRMNAFTGILLALLARHRTGKGQKVDTSMLDGQVSLLTYLATAWLNTEKVPPRMGNRHLSIAVQHLQCPGWLA